MDRQEKVAPEAGMRAMRMGESSVAHLFGKGAQGVLGLLIVVLLLALLVGVIRTFLDLHEVLSASVSVQAALRQVILDVLILLAVLEIFRTVLRYFSEGRVKVTFIVDTLLVVMLAELLALWFSEATNVRLGALLVVIGVLGVLRALVVKFSPDCYELGRGKGKGGEGDVVSHAEGPEVLCVRDRGEAVRTQPLRDAGVLHRTEAPPLSSLST